MCSQSLSKDSSDRSCPNDWEAVRADCLFTLEYGKGLSEKERVAGPYPVLGSNGVVGYHNEAVVKGPGIVVGRKGSIGAVTWVASDFWPIDTTYYVRTRRNDVSLKWLFYELVYLNPAKFRLADVVPGLKRELVHSMMISLPPLPEQKKIAAVLSVVDSAILKVDEVIWKTERLKKGLMQTLLTKGIGHTEYKDTPIGKTPKAWQIVRLNEIGKFQYGYTVSATKENTGTKLLRITDIKENGHIDWSDVPYCDVSEDDYERYGLRLEDVLFARIGATTGKTCYIGESVRGVFGSYLIRFHPNEVGLDTRFLYFFTQSSQYWNQMNRVREGRLKKGVNTTTLGELTIPLPSLEEQKKINEILSTIDRKITFDKAEKAKLERVKRGLMDLLLTGKVRVKVD